MKKTLAVLLSVLSLNLSAATLYFDDGSSIEVPVGHKVYVSSGVVWSFTRFNAGGFDIRPLEEAASVEEECTQENGFTFGGGSVVCEEVVETPEEESCQDQLGFGHGC
jgi:hypothetical protein